MNYSGHLFVFTIEHQRFGLNLEVVQRIEKSVEITKVPEIPPLISGIINYHGKILPVFDLRKKLKFPGKELSISMRFIIINTDRRSLIIVADSIEGVINVSKEIITRGTEIENSFDQVSFVRLEDGILFIYDVEKFLSSGEELELEKALCNCTFQSLSQ